MSSLRTFNFIILLFLLLTSPVAANPVTASDPEGDATGSPVDAGAPGFTDLVAIVATVNETTVAVDFEFASLQELVLTEALLSSEAWLEIRYRDEIFHLVYTIYGGNDTIPLIDGGPDGAADWGTYRQGEAGWSLIEEGPLDWQRTDAMLTAQFPLTSIRTQSGFSPAPGEVIYVQSAGTQWDSTPEPSRATMTPVVFEYRDTAGFADGSILIVPGGAIDELLFATPNPVRFSNGEATTFHWPVEATNPTNAAIQVELELSGLDDATARVPALVTVEPASSRVFDIFVTVPFRHLHGESRAITLTSPATSNALELRIDYPVVPQPAGHHRAIYLHVAHSENELQLQQETWINTLSKDDADSGLPAAYTARRDCSNGLPGVAWAYPLTPGLGIGLRGIEGRMAALELELVAPQIASAGILEAGFAIYDTTQALETAIINETSSIDVPQLVLGSSQLIEMDVPWAILNQPFQPGSNLGFIVTYCPDVPEEVVTVMYMSRDAAPAMQISPGARVDLPLLDYAASEELSVAATSPIRVVGAETIRAAPGAQIVWTLEMTSKVPGNYLVSLLGADASIVTAHDDTSIRLDDAPTTWRIAALIPEDVANEETLEFVVLVEDANDAAIASGTRLSIIIEETSTRDDRELAAAVGAPNGQDSPAPALLLAILVAVIVARRRNW